MGTVMVMVPVRQKKLAQLAYHMYCVYHLLGGTNARSKFPNTGTVLAVAAFRFVRCPMMTIHQFSTKQEEQGAWHGVGAPNFSNFSMLFIICPTQ